MGSRESVISGFQNGGNNNDITIIREMIKLGKHDELSKQTTFV